MWLSTIMRKLCKTWLILKSVTPSLPNAMLLQVCMLSQALHDSYAGANLRGCYQPASCLIFTEAGERPPPLIFVETGQLTVRGHPGATTFLLKKCLRPTENFWIRTLPTIQQCHAPISNLKGALDKYNIYLFIYNSIENFKLNQYRNFQLILPERFHFMGYLVNSIIFRVSHRLLYCVFIEVDFEK